MQATIGTAQTATPSKAALWAGRVISGLAVAFLVFDGIGKVMNIQPVIDSSIQLGLPSNLAPSLGILLLACVALYLFPRTAVLGAVLLTGYLGGAIAIQAWVGAVPFSLVFPVIMGALVWGGLFLRDGLLRALVLRR